MRKFQSLRKRSLPARVRLVEDCQRSINDRVKNAIKYLDTNEWKP